MPVHMESTQTNQHWVPQFLLRRFACTASGKQICVFDKLNERSFTAAISNVASGKAFYDCQADGKLQSIDPLLTKMENAASNFIASIVTRRSLAGLSETGRKMIALFAAVHMVRTESQRKQLKSMIDHVANALLPRFCLNHAHAVMICPGSLNNRCSCYMHACACRH